MGRQKPTVFLLIWASCLLFQSFPLVTEGAEPQPKATTPVQTVVRAADLLPADTVFLWHEDGYEKHAEVYSKTAAHDALSATGVYAAALKLVTFSLQMTEVDPATTEFTNTIRDALDRISNQGFSIAVSLPSGQALSWPVFTLILPKLKAFPDIQKVVTTGPSPAGAVSRSAVDWQQQTIGNRIVWSSSIGDLDDGTGPLQVHSWIEGPYCVVVVGVAALPAALAVAEKENANITTHRLWKRLHLQNPGFVRRSFGWLDVVTIRSRLDDIPFRAADLQSIGLEGILAIPMMLPSFLTLSKYSEAPISASAVQPLPQSRQSQESPYYSLDAAPQSIPANTPASSSHSVNDTQPLIESSPQAGHPVADLPPLAPVFTPGTQSPQPGIVPLKKYNSAPIGRYPTRPDPSRDGSRPTIPPEAANSANLSAQGPPTFATGDATDPDERPMPPDLPVTDNSTVFTLRTMLSTLGIDSIQDWTWQAGYRGRANWSESSLNLQGSRQGIMAWGSTRQMSITDLPPLPAKIHAFTARTLDLQNVMAGCLFLFHSLTTTFATDTTELQVLTTEFARQIHVDALIELTQSLDTVTCTYNDEINGPLSFGPVFVWKVKDATRLRKAINRLLESPAFQKAIILVQAVRQTNPSQPAPDAEAKKESSLEQVEVPPASSKRHSSLVEANPPVQTAPDAKPTGDSSDMSQFQFTRKHKYGRELITLQGLGSVLVVDEQWLVIGMNSQLVEAFLLRVDGKLTSWQQTAEHQTAMKELPPRFTSISVDDPRQTLPALFALAPAFLNMLDVALQQSVPSGSKEGELLKQIDLAEFPPAEMIVQPLFPNITLEIMEDGRTRRISRSSLPAYSFWDAAPILTLVTLYVASSANLL